MKKENGIITIEFDENGKAEFDIYTRNDGELLTALLGLEGYVASRTGLDCEDIRELIDEEKKSVQVRPKKVKD